MIRSRILTALVTMLTVLALLLTAAMAADSESAKQQAPTYRKVTGEVVSTSPTSIVIKGRSKDALTLAVTDKTDVIGAKAVKAGDRAAVNYRADQSGNTATRITLLSTSVKTAAPPTAAQ